LDLHVSIYIFLNFLHSPYLFLWTTHLERDHIFFRTWSICLTNNIFVYSQCMSRIFGGSKWQHDLGYSQCIMCLWSVCDLDLGSMINLSINTIQNLLRGVSKWGSEAGGLVARLRYWPGSSVNGGICLKTTINRGGCLKTNASFNGLTKAGTLRQPPQLIDYLRRRAS
jgi:hypothetical protein